MSKFTHTAESRPLEGYTIKRPLHRGGFGEVYFAVSDGGRDVALKLLQHNVDVELRGVQQCLNLSHPNLVTIFDVRQDGDGDYWIVMEYVPGETLDEVLRRENRPLPMQEVLRWMRGLCAGVTYMHQRGIVHRDLKPSNIFGADGTVKIGDIGLSKFITASRRSAHTESVGTVYYMAPEISRGRYGNEVDIYAIGIIAYELLTGDVPFDGESAGEILMKHLTQPPNLKAVPERLRPVIQRALAKDPQQRQRSVAAFLGEFEAAVVGRGESARPRPVEETMNTPVMPYRTPLQRALDGGDSTPWYGHWLVLVLISIPMLFALRSGATPFGVALFGGFACAAVAFTTKTMQFGAELIHGLSGAPARPVPVRRAVMNSPLVPIRSTGERAASLTTSAFFAPLFVTALTGAMSYVQPTLLEVRQDNLSLATLFVVVATIGTWVVSLISTIGEGKDWDRWTRRGMFGVGGLVTGTAAYVVWTSLFSPKATLLNTDSHGALFWHFGSHLLSQDHTPTLAGFLCFFGFFFALVNWNKQTGLSRASRFRVGPLLESLLAAWLVTRVLVFPSLLACLWVGVISASVQLTSPWMAKAKR
jgi:serine/threonine protein kinase